MSIIDKNQFNLIPFLKKMQMFCYMALYLQYTLIKMRMLPFGCSGTTRGKTPRGFCGGECGRNGAVKFSHFIVDLSQDISRYQGKSIFVYMFAWPQVRGKEAGVAFSTGPCTPIIHQPSPPPPALPTQPLSSSLHRQLSWHFLVHCSTSLCFHILSENSWSSFNTFIFYIDGMTHFLKAVIETIKYYVVIVLCRFLR